MRKLMTSLRRRRPDGGVVPCSLAPAAFAQAVMYKADLKAPPQVPPNDSKGTAR